ncbi:MAG TPA: hypothetical protein VIS99_15045 [Terrimicrobiaceae bacterium]
MLRLGGLASLRDARIWMRGVRWCRGWLFGSERLREQLLKMLAKRPARIENANGYHGPQLSDYEEQRARALVRAALEHFGTDLATLRRVAT